MVLETSLSQPDFLYSPTRERATANAASQISFAIWMDEGSVESSRVQSLLASYAFNVAPTLLGLSPIVIRIIEKISLQPKLKGTIDELECAR